MNRNEWRVLVAVDSPVVRAEVRRLLRLGSERSYELIEVDTGTAVLQLWEQADCILLDDRLPDMDALEVLEALRAGHAAPPCPIVVLTESVGRDYAARVLRAGAMDYLGKGWMNPESLPHALENAVERYVLHQRTALSLDVSRLLSEDRDGQDVLPKSLRTLVEGLGWELGVLWMPDSSGSVLRCREVWHRDAPALERFAAASRLQTVAPGACLPGRIWAGERTAWIPDLTRDPGFTRAALAAEAGLRSGIGFSILLEGKCLGVVEIFSGVLRPRDDELLRLVGGIGSQLGQFLERKRTEAALRESEERLRLLGDNLPDSAVYQYTREADGSPRFLYYSAGIERLCGVRAEEAVRDASLLYRQVPPEHLPRIFETEAESARTMSDFEAEVPIRRRDGELRWMRVRSRPRQHEGRVLWDGVQTDITERKLAEERLRHSEAALRAQELRYRLVVEAANDALWDWDLSTDQTDWSDRLRTLFGHDPQGIDRTSSFWEEQLHPDDRERVLRGLGAALEGSGEAWRQEYRFRRADGSYATVYDRGRIVRDEGGRATRMVGSMMDLSEQKAAEREAKEREHRLRLAMECAATGMWDWDVATDTVSWSPECYVIHGLKPGEFDGTAEGFDRLLHPEDRTRVWEHVRAAVKQQTKYTWEFRIVRPSGEVRWVANLGRALYDEQGQPVRMIGTLTDITDRKHFEEALRLADRRKDEFLATLSHELRSPLAPLRSAVDVLRTSAQPDPMLKKACDVIERQVLQMVRLVDDLLDVSRISQGKVQLQKVPLDLAAVVQQAVEMSQPLISSRRHALSVSLPVEPLHVEGDPARLAQVVCNLLNNAAKYTDKGGQIALTLKREESERGALSVVRVRDNGRGIEPAALGSLFTLFYQAESNLDRSEGGLGIGLSLVRSLVQLHGGQVEAHSTGAGKGSEFIVRLPVLAEAAPPSGSRARV